jgi:hypothetical protein
MDSVFFDHLTDNASVTVWHAVEIVLPERTIRVCDAGIVSFDGKDFASADPVFGVLGTVSPVSDGTDNQAARVEIEFKPNETGIATEFLFDTDGEIITDTDDEPILVDVERAFIEEAQRPQIQLSAVTVWWGATDADTGEVIGEPEGAFHALLDTSSVSISDRAWSITFDCCSVLDYALQADEGMRLSPAFHKSVWGSLELGLDAVTGVQRDTYWGMSRPLASILYPGGTGSGPIWRWVTGNS